MTFLSILFLILIRCFKITLLVFIFLAIQHFREHDYKYMIKFYFDIRPFIWFHRMPVIEPLPLRDFEETLAFGHISPYTSTLVYIYLSEEKNKIKLPDLVPYTDIYPLHLFKINQHWIGVFIHETVFETFWSSVYGTTYFNVFAMAINYDNSYIDSYFIGYDLMDYYYCLYTDKALIKGYNSIIPQHAENFILEEFKVTNEVFSETDGLDGIQGFLEVESKCRFMYQHYYMLRVVE